MSEPPVVIFMTSNGVGMGHLSRQLAVALSRPPGQGSVVFSLSGALPRIMAADASGELPEAGRHHLRYEYCPSRESRWLPEQGWRRVLRQTYRSYRWHPYLRDRLVALAVETRAAAVVFDGVVPYEGLLQARTLLPGVAFVWVRRGMWRPDALTHRLQHSEEFDLVIEPGDYGAVADRGPLAERTDARRIPPVSLVDVLAPASREASRASLGLPQDRPVLLLAPGAGALGSVDEVAARIQRAVAARNPDWVVAVTRQSIAEHGIGDRSRSRSTVMLDDVYPLARHLQAFDAAASAAGYNAVHELLGQSVPTLLVPSVHHVTDDQSARADGAAQRGAALRADGNDVDSAVAKLLDDGVRHELRRNCAALEPATGGRAAARLVDEALTGARPASRTGPPPRPRRPWVDARTAMSSDVRLAEQISVGDVRGPTPVEHLIEGGSPQYRASRSLAAQWLYRRERGTPAP
ncbi:MAG TPA: hypothetical protein VJ976_01015 [Ornithinimicrobium sp.]|uniref:hypothetical protein n=1 Tax=Ornithinimicrobium sp. TaxID=1977084 RepID=UPI002B46EED1|nr:hypothetical protein [Ornithinimicrobium sp.]HKJ10947.1 hypothetical protein [Ornithinimicrobium sp.]